jgi:hypothetical protein
LQLVLAVNAKETCQGGDLPLKWFFGWLRVIIRNVQHGNIRGHHVHSIKLFAMTRNLKTCYALGLLSMLMEVGGMVIVALLPAIAGFGTQYESKLQQGVLAQAWHLIDEG